MLNTLFGEWQPGGAASSNSTSRPHPAGARSGLAGKLHTISAPDDSRPHTRHRWVDGGSRQWPRNHHHQRSTRRSGCVRHDEKRRGLIEGQWQQNPWRMGGKPIPGTILYPYHGNLTREFPTWCRHGGAPRPGASQVQIEKIEQMPPPQGGSQGEECVKVKGQLDTTGPV